MEDESWIKLHRKFLKWEWYDDINTKVLFLHLLLNANYEEKKWRGQIVKRGQLITSINHLAEDTKLSVRQIRVALDKLKMTNEITIKTTNKFTLITIEKYSIYQVNNKTNDTQDDKQCDNQVSNKRQTNDKQMTTTKEIKNIRNKELKNNKKEINKEKIHFAEFVYMTNAEYEKLISTYGKDFADQCITTLDNYKGSSGKKYKDDYRAILSWVVDRVKKQQPKPNVQSGWDYINEEFEKIRGGYNG